MKQVTPRCSAVIAALSLLIGCVATVCFGRAKQMDPTRERGTLAEVAALPPRRFEFRSAHMGTQFRIVLYTPDESSANAASDAAFARIAELDAMLSDYQAESELMQLCAKAGGPPVRVSDELYAVLARSQELARRSDGAFDVTVGPIVRLWRRARRQHKLPDPERLEQARALVGAQHVRMNDETHTVQLLKPGMQLDLGGIAKGYAADEAIRALKQRGIDRALVAAAGDIVVSAPPPDEPGWTIAIVSPEGADRPPLDFLLLHDAGISTSGDTEQFMELDGKRYSHIVNPKTAQALTERLQVTVIAPNGITADSLDTAVSVMGIEKGLQLIEATPHVAALLVSLPPSGPVLTPSKRYPEIPKGKPKS
jgi:thiamine biosynthesis lipoprotein